MLHGESACTRLSRAFNRAALEFDERADRDVSVATEKQSYETISASDDRMRVLKGTIARLRHCVRVFSVIGGSSQRARGCASRGAHVFVGLLSSVAPLAVQAQTRSTNDDQGVIEINDPTSPLRWLQLSDWYNASLHGESGSINDGVFRAVLPFTVLGDQYAVRFTQQATISSYNNKNGFQDPELILVRLIDQGWGRWLVGMVVRPPSGAESLTSHAWSLGPALGFTTSSEAGVKYGAHLRGWWSVDAPSNAKPVGIINLQPVINIKLGNGQALTLGQSQLEYDTVKGHWKSLQLGLRYDKVFTIADRKWTPYFETDYDFENTKGNPAWTLRVGITMFEAEKPEK